MTLATPRTSSDDRWNAVLDALLESVATGEPVDLPDDLGPLPAHLAERATEVLDVQRRAMQELGARRDEVAAELAALPRGRAARGTAAGRSGTSGFRATL
jgi:hypothetical protein